MRFEPDFGKIGFARDVLRLRGKLGSRYRGLTQEQFAKRFGLSVGTVKDCEQGRVSPSKAMMLLMAAIELDPALIDRAVVLAAERLRVREESAAALKRAERERMRGGTL